MPIEFDREVGFEGSLLIGWATVDRRRVRCLASRETINELPGFTHATATEIRTRKGEIFQLLIPKFRRKIEQRQFDHSTIPSVTLFLRDLRTVS